MCCANSPQRLSVLDGAHQDPYHGHRPIALAFANFLTLQPSARYLSSVPAPTTAFPPLIHHETLDTFIARVVHMCEVPDIVPYTALYILSSFPNPRRSSRSRSSSSPSSLTLSSSFSHQLSRAMSCGSFFTHRKPRWTGYIIFLSAFLVALRAYHNPLENQDIPDMETLSIITGYSEKDLDGMEKSIRAAIDEETWDEVVNMLQRRWIRPLKCTARERAESGRKRGHWQRLVKIVRGGPRKGDSFLPFK